MKQLRRSLRDQIDAVLEAGSPDNAMQQPRRYRLVKFECAAPLCLPESHRLTATPPRPDRGA